MRLKSLYMKDFRSIDGEIDISLDAPIVLIHGPNGAGKTSLLTAIELALTGAVPSLSRAEPDYLTYLPHKDRPFGEVRLEVTADDGEIRRGDVRVTTNAVTGQALLSHTEANFFSERSYLAQSTLGRLLEIYQHADKKSDSPLTRFVKELLGLDRMDALIGGLHTAGNIARLKVPVPAYGETRDRIPAEEVEIAALGDQVKEAEIAIRTHDEDLRGKVAMVDPAQLDLPPADIIAALKGVSEESDLTALVRSRRELEVSRSGWGLGYAAGFGRCRPGCNRGGQPGRGKRVGEVELRRGPQRRGTADKGFCLLRRRLGRERSELCRAGSDPRRPHPDRPRSDRARPSGA
ncbi:AAA family ATPase [Aurantimonas sp. C2-6-R+9]|uniref:AAA family ATPase n=1 Tax=unclassified Aurantimonas TaxID=2638230 RepID=UPI002E19DEF5|nr:MULTISPECIES: AAA family ATPase [unclassified Aurantimonas]MEC5293005.1 AAA family ATPase [Aurantimonas sp. C2-3-R2]MEC5381113.1 AAA family ATPase [Aurantimonas sp. C2-6-R+9]MEC5414014.1 AAA family ATPase [Aurantimonas sp. C2-4-R8]